MPTPAPTDYRLAPLLVARLVGLYLVVLAVVVFVATALVASVGLSGDLLVALLGVGLVGLFALAWALRSRLYVVRLDESGYRVRLVRGAGVKQARWSEVEDAVAATPRSIPCVVIRLRDGGTTTIPVGLLAIDRDRFADELRSRLQEAHRRPGGA